jgi:hypothetical protein
VVQEKKRKKGGRGMGDVPFIVGCLIGVALIYDIILLVLVKNTEATPRPDLEEGGKEK